MNSSAALQAAAAAAIVITKADPNSSAFVVTGRESVAVKAGTIVAVEGFTWSFAVDTPVTLPPLQAGRDYAVRVDVDGTPIALAAPSAAALEGAIGGFHFAPGGNAPARAGGDDVPAINPFSCWDLNFRPACADPRGMTFIDSAAGRFWADIYLLNSTPFAGGTSVFGLTIADGDDCPGRLDGSRYDEFTHAVAAEVLGTLGKQLPSCDEFRALAFGVTEKSAAGRDPKVTGLDVLRTSATGVMQATGNLWQWGHDGDPDTPRASIFGGSWVYGGNAGSRCAGLGVWAENSLDGLSARGRSDHLMRV